MSLQAVTEEFLGRDSNVRFEDWEGGRWGPADAPVTVRFNCVDAIKYLVRNPGELGIGRAYVSGALDIEGDIWTLLDLRRDLGGIRFSPSQVRRLIRDIGFQNLRGAPPVPAEEVDVGSRFRAHTRQRDRKAISHHYDVSNEFYRMVLGPSWTYSCAVFQDPADSLEQAQANKYELICRKLALEPGMRLLDVGCGWGGMALHAAANYGVDVVGITISDNQAELARRRVAEAGLEDRIDIRLRDYRDLSDGPFDAISSIGMFEHVGLAHLTDYFEILRSLLPDSGRLLNHQIGRLPQEPTGRIVKREQTAIDRKGFIHRYVFPDGELHEIGSVVGAMQRVGFEARHLESLREHYALTLRRWVENLEANWDAAVAEVGEGRARVWRLYMAATSINFAIGRTQVHQVLGVKTAASGRHMGRSGMPLRYRWEYDLSQAGAGDPAQRSVARADDRPLPRLSA
jgi:cyclopropane-fatty-acyl-phospholipid synthase